MSKKDVKIRKDWPSENFDPSTKIHKVETSYQRQNKKKEIEDALQEAEEENSDVDNWL